MLKTTLALSLILVAAPLFAAAAPKAAPAKSEKKADASQTQTLTAGRYTAKVAMLACSGCGPNIEQALKTVPGIESAKVDSDKSTVEFAVKKDAKVGLAAVQKALKRAADDMGMGADYTLSKIQSVSRG